MIATLNLGTFDKAQARQLGWLLRSSSKTHKRERITGIKFRGRGRRALGGHCTAKLRQDLPPALAPKLAVYVSVEMESVTETLMGQRIRQQDEELMRLRGLLCGLRDSIRALEDV